MPERISDIPILRRELVNGISPANAAILRSTVLENQHYIRYFANPTASLRAACAFSKVALSEYRGLDILYIMAVTAQDPIQLANSMGAIGATSYVNGLVRNFDKKPEDLSYISTKYSQSVQGFKKSLNGSPSGSFVAESLTGIFRPSALNTQTPDKSDVITALTQEVYNPTPDRETLLSLLVEASFLFALDTDAKDPTFKLLKDKTSTDFLTYSYPLFAATERLLASSPEYFDIVFGIKASFWREYRYNLFPDLLNVANKIIEDRALIKNWQADPVLIKTVGKLYEVAKAEFKAQEERKEAAANPEKYAWRQAKAEFELRWKNFITKYIQDNGQLGSPLTHFEFVDLFTQGIGILHEAIFAGKNDSELRAGMETILPKFWPHEQLGYVYEDYLNEYEYDQDGNPVKIILPGEKVLAQIIYLPEELRPSKLGSAIQFNQTQQSARNKIVRSLSKAAHPDRSYAYSDPKNAAAMVDFLKIANEYKNYLN